MALLRPPRNGRARTLRPTAFLLLPRTADIAGSFGTAPIARCAFLIPVTICLYYLLIFIVSCSHSSIIFLLSIAFRSQAPFVSFYLVNGAPCTCLDFKETAFRSFANIGLEIALV